MGWSGLINGNVVSCSNCHQLPQQPASLASDWNTILLQHMIPPPPSTPTHPSPPHPHPTPPHPTPPTLQNAVSYQLSWNLVSQWHLVSCPINRFQFLHQHGSDTVVPCTKFYNDWTARIYVLNKRKFTRDLSLGWVSEACHKMQEPQAWIVGLVVASNINLYCCPRKHFIIL